VQGVASVKARVRVQGCGAMRVSIEEEHFNFSRFRRKLKFHIFSFLKFYFKIPKI